MTVSQDLVHHIIYIVHESMVWRGKMIHIRKIIVGLVLIVTPTVSSQTADQAQPRVSHRENYVVRAVREAKDAVVNISTSILIRPEEESGIFQFFPPEFRPGPTTAHSLGSGFVIHPSGYIITNAHVVQQANEIIVSFADKSIPSVKAEPLYIDDEHDLAVIKIKPSRPLHVLPLGRGDDLMIGETAIAIGNPLGLGHTVTVGVVSADKRTLNFPNGKSYRDLIQTDTSINPGNSGGPLLNIDGELIGINTAIRGDAQNIGFAINVDALKKLMPELLGAENIRRINLGVRFATDPSGSIRVQSINQDSPAHKAGIQAGDLITHYEGKRVRHAVDFYIDLLEHPVGKPLTLTILRDEKHYNVTVPFEAKPKPSGHALAKSKLGLLLHQLTGRQARQMGLADRPVLIVERTMPGSPAEQAGIRKGDIIDKLDTFNISNFEQVGQILDSYQPGQSIVVRVVRIRGNMIYSAELQLPIQ